MEIYRKLIVWKNIVKFKFNSIFNCARFSSNYVF